MKILIDGQTLETQEINRGIGNYFKNVVNNIIKIDFINEWYITVSNKSFVKKLDPWVVDKLNIIENQKFSPSNINTSLDIANREYTEEIQKTISNNNIELYWNPNPVMQNVMFPVEKLNCDFFATFYDLIPLVFKNKYINNWPNELKNEYMRRLNYLNSKENNIIFISNASQSDFDKFIGTDYKKGYVTFLAADSKKYYTSFSFDINKKSPYNILYVGGFDFRKNMYPAVEAFAEAKSKYKGTIMDEAYFDIVCSMNLHEKEEFEKYLKKINILDYVKLNGFISEMELVRKYKECDIFFFPSLYEGFGLPILEALLSGAFVLSADNSSLKEVGQEYCIYCDAEDVHNMSVKIYEALEKSINEKRSKREARSNYALNFGWYETAQLTLNCFNSFQKEERVNSKLAIVTPWLPQKTGIANWIFKLTKSLKKYFDIDIYVDDSVDSIKEYVKLESINIKSIFKFRENANKYNQIIYQLGNNSQYHTEIYKLALEIPGIVEIHDYNINPFMYQSFLLNGDKKIFEKAINYYGEEGKEHYKELSKGSVYPNIYKFPMIHYVASKSKGTIAHSKWVKENMNEIKNVSIIPLPAFEKDDFNKEFNLQEFSERYNLGANDLIISCLGFINKNKRPYKVIDAIHKLRLDGYPCKLLLLGSGGDEESQVIEYAEKLDIKNDIIITGFLDDFSYYEGIEFSDIIVNLRYPSMGESSATLCETFKYGKPVLVSNINQYKEFPDEICWKVDINDFEVEQIYNYIKYLLKNREVREAIGNNAKIYADKVLDADNIAEEYLQVLSKY